MNNSTLTHVGIIMDGNGRWAKQRGLMRSKGHSEGLKATKTLVAHVAQSAVQVLSLYTFSSENWTRAKDEVGALMDLISTHLKAQLPFYHEHGIRIMHSGSKERLSRKILADFEQIEAATQHHSSLILNLLVDYGGQEEIVRACNRIASKQLAFTAEHIRQHLDQQLPMLDCVIRTAGEQRLSNFMIWQAAYAEFIYSAKLWPDFSPQDFDLAIKQYTQRHRTFGGT